MTGQRKAEAVRAHAQHCSVDLQNSFAFGDALGDLPMLECVGRPVAVNPGRRLAAQATRRGWPIERWR
jgi:phosphoserine phosphatase